MTRTPGRRASAPRRKVRPTLSPEERAERVSAAREQLLDGIDKLMTSEGWQQLITSHAWLRRYSLNNIIMILQQCPDATDVRPLSEWRQEGYAYMRKGTHKIKIWKPRFRKVDAERLRQRRVRRQPRRANRRRRALSGFMLVPVVDVSQLQGDPRANRPAPPCPIELTGDAPADSGMASPRRSRHAGSAWSEATAEAPTGVPRLPSGASPSGSTLNRRRQPRHSRTNSRTSCANTRPAAPTPRDTSWKSKRNRWRAS